MSPTFSANVLDVMADDVVEGDVAALLDWVTDDVNLDLNVCES